MAPEEAILFVGALMAGAERATRPVPTFTAPGTVVVGAAAFLLLPEPEVTMASTTAITTAITMIGTVRV